MTKILVDSELLFKAEQLFDELRGEVNPERGYANELEAEILIARDQFRAALDAPSVPEGWQLVPKEPPPGLLMSMAIRFDHGLGVPGYYDTIPLYEGCTHDKHLESTLLQMRQLYEEVSGQGFYKPERESEYAAMAAQKGEKE